MDHDETSGDRPQRHDSNRAIDCQQVVWQQSVWQQTYEQTVPGLRAFLRTRLTQESDIDDCLQAVSIAMIEKGSSVRPAAMRSWLFRVAANESARIWRSRASQDKVLKNYLAPEQENRGPLENSLKSESTEALRRAVQRLPNSWQQVLHLRIHDNLTFQQIADQLEIPLGTALSRMRRALDQLRCELTGDQD